MSAPQPYIGQILAVGFNFAPQGWALCDGRLLPISQNTALFSLLGTNYGGDGVQTFALPDLRGRLVVGQGQGPGLSTYNVGQAAGQEFVTLSSQQMPAHTHTANVASTVTTATPGPTTVLGTPSTGNSLYVTTAPNTNLAPTTISSSSGGTAHENRQPVLAITYVISLFGIFPSRN